MTPAHSPRTTATEGLHMGWIGSVVIALAVIAIVAAIVAKPKTPDPPDDIYTLY